MNCSVQSSVLAELRQESRRCECNKKFEDNSPNALNDKTYHLNYLTYIYIYIYIYVCVCVCMCVEFKAIFKNTTCY